MPSDATSAPETPTLPTDFVDRLLRHDRRALARALTWIENGTPQGEALLGAVYAHGGKAHVVGVTGAGGSGKSTLVSALTRELRGRGQEVGIIAVDPSSPFTRGAILGDRIRMQDHSLDPGVFIRSMASRGALGGIAAATDDAVTVMSASGMDTVIVETLGAGQDEVEIVRTAQTTVLVLTPNTGDDVQAMKAGIIEIADILVVNKADLPGADQIAGYLRGLLSLIPHGEYVPPILKTSAAKREGIVELVEALGKHRRYLEESGEMGRRAEAAARHHTETVLRDALVREALAAGGGEAFEAAVAAVRDRRLDPRRAARSVLEAMRT